MLHAERVRHRQTYVYSTMLHVLIFLQWTHLKIDAVHLHYYGRSQLYSRKFLLYRRKEVP